MPRMFRITATGSLARTRLIALTAVDGEAALSARTSSIFRLPPLPGMPPAALISSRAFSTPAFSWIPARAKSVVKETVSPILMVSSAA